MAGTAGSQNAAVKFYDASLKQWVVVPETDLEALKSLGPALQLAQTWCLTALPDVANTRFLLAAEALAKDGASATIYKALLDARLVLYDGFRMALGGNVQTQVMSAFLQVADAGIQSFVNERERLQFRLNVSKVLGLKVAGELIGQDDALTSLRSFAAVLATAMV